MSERESSHALARSRRHRLVLLAVVGAVALVAGVVTLLRLPPAGAPSPVLAAAVAEHPAGAWWTTEIEGAGAPGSPGRAHHLLAEVEWTDEQAARLAEGLLQTRATPADAAPGRWSAARDRARALLVAAHEAGDGEGSRENGVDVRLQGAVLAFLEPWTGAMTATLRPPSREPFLSVAPLDEASPDARLAVALWRDPTEGSDDVDLVRGEVLLGALEELGDDVAAAEQLVTHHLAWLHPYAVAEVAEAVPASEAAAAVDGLASAFDLDDLAWDWLDPAAAIASSLARGQCRPARRTCVGDLLDAHLAEAAWRATYDGVPLAVVPPTLVVGGSRLPWDALDAAQRSLVVQAAYDGTFPSPPVPTTRADGGGDR